MQITRHLTSNGPRWALDGRYLGLDFSFSGLLKSSREEIVQILQNADLGPPVSDRLIAPLDDAHEVWACGVTYLRSREARMSESDLADVYDKVYNAERPEIFLKSIGWRVRGPEEPFRIREDSTWDVPEPELCLVINSRAEILGYTLGNDVSSRSIEGENPLYLPQAKFYKGSCVLGPAIQIASSEEFKDIEISIEIERGAETVFEGSISSSSMKRSYQELVSFLYRELDFPDGCLLMTGTGVVPDDSFTLETGDRVEINIGNLTLSNTVG